MKLSEYAKLNSITYKTAWLHFKAGLIPNAIKLKTGTIVIQEIPKLQEKIALYSRVSSSENKSNAEAQLDRLRIYAIAKGYQINKEVIEIASGLNDARPKLILLLQDKSITKIIVEHKDRLTRFGFNYINVLLENSNRSIEVINESLDNDDIIADFISIITSFCARIYGRRRSKRKTELLLKELENDLK
jgi:predicted site-specific integrase-resolvase